MGAWALFMFHQGGGEAVIDYDIAHTFRIDTRQRQLRIEKRQRQVKLDDR